MQLLPNFLTLLGCLPLEPSPMLGGSPGHLDGHVWTQQLTIQLGSQLFASVRKRNETSHDATPLPPTELCFLDGAPDLMKGHHCPLCGLPDFLTHRSRER